MLRLEAPALSAFPANLIGPAEALACPWCHATCASARDEDGRSIGPVDVTWYDPPASGPSWSDRGLYLGWCYGMTHVCRPMLMAFRASTIRPEDRRA